MAICAIATLMYAKYIYQIRTVHEVLNLAAKDSSFSINKYIFMWN